MKKDRDILGIVALTLAFVLMVSGGLFVWNTFFAGEPEPDDEDPIIVETVIDVALKDATVFRLKELDFQFVIAELTVTSNKKIDLGLEMFSTSEGIALNNVSFYIDKIKENGLTLEKLGLADAFRSDEKSITAKVFIPILDKAAKSLTLSVNLTKKIDLNFDLSIATGTKYEIGLTNADLITDGNSYKITLGKMISLNNEPVFHSTPSGEKDLYDFSETSNLVALEISIEGLNSSSVGIDDAQFIADGSTISAYALTKSYTSDGYLNVIDMAVTEGKTGYLYLQINDVDESLLDRNGTLKLKLTGSQEWIIVFYLDTEA